MSESSYDLRVFNEAARAITAIPGRFGPEVVNTAVMKVLIGTGSGPGLVQLTPKAEKARIEADMKKDGLLLKLAAKWLRTQAYTGNRKTALKKAAKRILAARVRSRTYIAAGWLAAARKLRRYVKGNLSRLGKQADLHEKGEAQKSFVMPARGNILNAGAFNTSNGAKVVSPDSLVQVAVDYAAHDMLIYIERKLGAAIADAINGGRSAESVIS
jgi:hypothetical protein